MPECDVCGKQVDLPYNCNECGDTFCADHRLPENHDCPGLQDWGDPKGTFDAGPDDGVENRGRSSSGHGSRGLGDRITGTGGFLGYFRGNVTYLMLALMWVTFGLQMFVLLGLPSLTGMTGNEAASLHRQLFVLDSRNPQNVWTVVTSIFSHAPSFPPMHLIGNSLVVYFFGRYVEEYVGSRNFLLLFLFSGVAAGLGQLALSVFAFGQPAAVLGASGAGLAILGVMTVINPNATVLLFIPIPIPVPVWLMTVGYAALSSFGILAGGNVGGVAHTAHLVGLAIGLVYGKRIQDEVSGKGEFRIGGGPGGPGGPGGGRRRGPF